MAHENCHHGEDTRSTRALTWALVITVLILFVEVIGGWWSNSLALLADGRTMVYGNMGGDGQPQTQAALLTRHVTYRQPLDKAIDAPRWLLGRTWGSTVTNLRMESRFDGHLIDRLMSAGHDIDVLPDAYSDTMGHAGAVVLHADGTLEGVHDPRADGGAAGV